MELFFVFKCHTGLFLQTVLQTFRSSILCAKQETLRTGSAWKSHWICINWAWYVNCPVSEILAVKKNLKPIELNRSCFQRKIKTRLNHSIQQHTFYFSLCEHDIIARGWVFFVCLHFGLSAFLVSSFRILVKQSRFHGGVSWVLS